MTDRTIAMVTPHYPPSVGGVETHVAALVRELTRTGEHVHVFAHGAASDDGAPVVEDGVVVRRFPTVGRVPFETSFSLTAALRSLASQYAVVHVHQYHNAAALLAALATKRRLPLVFTPHYHGNGHTRAARLAHRPYGIAGRWLLTRADAVLAVSEAEAVLITERFPAARTRLHVVPGGVDDRASGTEPFERPVPVVLVAGRLEPYKQVDTVVQAVAHLGDAVELVVLGDGPGRAQLEPLVAGLSRTHRARILLRGWVSDEERLRWFATARVGVSLSRHEAMGLSVAELAAAGAAVVLSSIPAHDELAARLGARAALVPVDASPETVAGAIAAAAALSREPVVARPWSETAAAVAEIYARVAAPARARLAS